MSQTEFDQHAGDRPRRRIAVMISQNAAVNHHLKTFEGIHLYASEVGNWQVVIDMFPYQQFQRSQRRYDGVIARATPELVTHAKKFNIPIVNVWRNSPVADDVSSVFVNFDTVGRMATEHLLARGLKNFGFLGYTNDLTSKLMLKGFRKELKKVGFNCSHCQISHSHESGPASWKKARTAIDKWINSFAKPMGIVASHDSILRILADISMVEHGISVPHELALVGAGNERAYCEQAAVPLTSIDTNFSMIGYQAAKLLDDLINGVPLPTEPIFVEPAGLIARQSTDVTAVDDVTVATALRFIASHCNESIQVRDVAKAASCSVRTLQRRFNTKLGRSIVDQIEYLRLERFKRLLLQSDLPVNILAVDCGFSNYKHLYSAFLRAEGVPPAKYRKNHRAEN